MTHSPTVGAVAPTLRPPRLLARSLAVVGVIGAFAAPAAATAAATAGAPAASASGTCGDWSTGDAAEPCGPGQTITFAPGTSSFLFDGGIYDSTQVWYFQANGQQALDLDLQSADDNIDAVLFAPDGSQLLPDDYVDGLFEATLPADGLYALVLTADTGGPYGLGVGIDNPEPLPMGDYGRIEFDSGSDEGFVQGSLAPNTVDTWLFNADAGQSATLGIASTSGTATFTVLDNTGEALATDLADWSGELPAEGFYTVLVSAPDTSSDYDLTLTIPGGTSDTDTLPKELFFAPGTDSGSITGELPPGGVSSWVFWAAAGQQATFESTGDPVSLEVWTPSDEPLAMAGDSNAEAVAELPENGLYVVYVWAAVDVGANYAIDITIPDAGGDEGSTGTAPDDGNGGNGSGDDGQQSGDAGSTQVEFPAGDDTVTIEDSLPAESWRTYVLSAEAGQQLYASVIEYDRGTPGGGDGVTIELYAPDGAQLQPAGSEASAVLPSSGEYRLVVGTGERGVDYVLDVAIY